MFELQSGSSVVTNLITFQGTNGDQALGPLVVDSRGDLFGTTQYGGITFNSGPQNPGYGTLFEIPSGSTTLVTLVNFDTSTGIYPAANLYLDSAGNLFGATQRGGPGGYGTVFEFTPGNNALTTLASLTSTISFTSTIYGSQTGVIKDSSGNIFGITNGTGNEGQIFEVPNGSNTVMAVASFQGTTGYGAMSALVEDSSGNLFGTASQGGAYNYGTVFEVSKGSGTVTTVAAFDGANGIDPNSLVVDSLGDLFGTTHNGGTSNFGTVFEIPAGSSQITTLLSFNFFGNGASPDSLVLDPGGNLFGTTYAGYYTGAVGGGGTVFELQPSSDTLTTLVGFDNSDGGPSDLIEDRGGNLIGALRGVGSGSIFEIPSGTDSVVGIGNMGGGSLLEDSSGNLFGLTGATSTTPGDASLFEIVASTGNTITLASINDQSLPVSLVEDSNGNFFGDTEMGGAYGDGYVFEVKHGSGTVTTLDSFDGANGRAPFGEMIADSNGNVFGTTYGGGATGDGTVFEVPAPPTILPPGTAGVAYSQTLTGLGGTGSSTFTESGTLPAGLTLSTTGVLSGAPTSAGGFTFTVTATSAQSSTSQTYALTVNPGAFAQYLVTRAGSAPVQAGSGFLVTVQAADQYGNPVSSYSGPASVTTGIAPSSPGSSYPATITINGSGLGYFLATLQQAGSYTVTASSGSFAGTTAAVSVTPGPEAKLGFAVQPISTPTGDVLPAVTVQVEDLYGNLISTDNSDSVTLGIASGPGSFTSGSNLTAAVKDGVAKFNDLTLVTPGTYQLSAVVPGLYTGPNSGSFTVLPLQVVSGSFQGTPSGFSLQVNAPFLVDSVTPALYGSGAGASATVTPTVTLTQTSGTPPAGSSLPYQVPGSLIVNAATNTLTFIETDTASVVNNGTPLLPDGVYVVHITSSGANGLQALNSGGGYLDGTNSGTPGHDYTATFTVGAGATGGDVLWVPATADGPGQALSAPGMNQVGGGYPVYLSDQTGKVTSIQATLTYNPALLSVTPTSTATFSVTVPAAGTAVLHYSGPALAAGLQTPIGFITATVPAGTMASPMPYKAKDLLTLSGVSLNGSAVAVVGGAAVHLVAYVGDADGNGAYGSSDALLMTRVVLQTDSGFSAYPLVDPVIVADTDGSGFIPSDAALQANEAGVGVPTANLPIPPIPSGVHFLALAEHVRLTGRTVTEVFRSDVQTTKSTKDTRQASAEAQAMLNAALVDPWLDMTAIMTHRTNIKMTHRPKVS